jgi:hypothetical protein
MSGYKDIGPEPVPVILTPLFEARWSYEEFELVMPFGPDSEGQVYAFSKPARVDGERLSGAYRLTQFPRRRVDGVLLPDVHGFIETQSGAQVATRAGGYGLQVPGEPGNRNVTHWMRMWTGAQELAWVNSAVAFGVGSFVGDEARVRYYVAAPAELPSQVPVGAPTLELLGTARWEYPKYDAVHQFGDREGVGYANSVGDVQGGILAGRWRGWHYPTYLRNGLYQLDAHAEIRGADGPIINRHAGLATTPASPSVDAIYDVVQYATFVTAAPRLKQLNSTLAMGVGFVRAPGLVRCSYYSVNAS